MGSLRTRVVRILLLIVAVVWLGAITGCGNAGGSITDTVDTIDTRNFSGVAGPPNAPLTPVALVPRAQYATANSDGALGFPGMSGDASTAFDSGLTFFITDHTADEGVGPLFNQDRCLGCHTNSVTLPSSAYAQGFRSVATPASSAERVGQTQYPAISKGNPPPTAAFTLYGDFSPASGAFDPLTIFGGPVQHVRATGPCDIDHIPAEGIDPDLDGGVDPITGVSALGFKRAQGERAGPRYIGRGLAEAIYYADIVALEDPEDTVNDFSTLPPNSSSGTVAVDGTGKTTDLTTGGNSPAGGDWISGRHNENRSDTAVGGGIVGGDPVVRVSRFGLRAAGPTLLQFPVGGSSGEMGMTSPFAPQETNNVENVGLDCESQNAPNPNLTVETIENLRTLIRLIDEPEVDTDLFTQNPPVGSHAADIQAGAKLFGVDLDAFRTRLTGAPPVGDDHARAGDRQLDCAECHTPILISGSSPAELGAGQLSNHYFPYFSDLLLHNMGQIPAGSEDPVPPPGTSNAGELIIFRSLADFALPGQGRALGNEWRTNPLIGMGVIGPPFMHDARVYIDLNNPVHTVGRSADTGATNVDFAVTDVDSAIRAAIELHDLPQNNGVSDLCPTVTATSQRMKTVTGFTSTCPTDTSTNRSEAQNVIRRWHLLTSAQQQEVIDFLKSI